MKNAKGTLNMRTWKGRSLYETMKSRAFNMEHFKINP